MFVLALLACSQTSAEPVPAAAPTIPEAAPTAPSIPEAMPAPASQGGLHVDGPIDKALTDTPGAVASLYTLSLNDDRSALTIDPAPRPVRDRRAAGRSAYTATDSKKGGKIIRLENGPFAQGGWVRGTLEYFVGDAGRRAQLAKAKFDLTAERDLLFVSGAGDTKPTIFAFSADPNALGLVGICTDVSVLEFGMASPLPPPPIVVRKPVIYLYPEAPTDVHVDVKLEGSFVARYPAMGPDGWSVKAFPDGRLQTANGRSYRYLFWEGEGADFALDPAQSHCVPGGETTAFLERVCRANALTDAECNDFVTYWLPSMAVNPYNLVTFPDEAYAAYATLEVEPRPDTVIRTFMAFRGLDAPIAAGEPPLLQRTRHGFTVVEWGGVDLGTRPTRLAGR